MIEAIVLQSAADLETPELLELYQVALAAAIGLALLAGFLVITRVSRVIEVEDAREVLNLRYQLLHFTGETRVYSRRDPPTEQEVIAWLFGDLDEPDSVFTELRNQYRYLMNRLPLDSVKGLAASVALVFAASLVRKTQGWWNEAFSAGGIDLDALLSVVTSLFDVPVVGTISELLFATVILTATLIYSQWLPIAVLTSLLALYLLLVDTDVLDDHLVVWGGELHEVPGERATRFGLRWFRRLATGLFVVYLGQAVVSGGIAKPVVAYQQASTATQVAFPLLAVVALAALVRGSNDIIRELVAATRRFLTVLAFRGYLVTGIVPVVFGGTAGVYVIRGDLSVAAALAITVAGTLFVQLVYRGYLYLETGLFREEFETAGRSSVVVMAQTIESRDGRRIGVVRVGSRILADTDLEELAEATSRVVLDMMESGDGAAMTRQEYYYDVMRSRGVVDRAALEKELRGEVKQTLEFNLKSAGGSKKMEDLESEVAGRFPRSAVRDVLEEWGQSRVSTLGDTVSLIGG